MGAKSGDPQMGREVGTPQATQIKKITYFRSFFKEWQEYPGCMSPSPKPQKVRN